MALHRGRGGRWRRGVGASHQGRRGLAGLAAALSILLLTGCPVIPPPERLAFDSDPRVLRGSYLGSVDTRATPTSMALAGDASLLVASWPGPVEVWDPETSELVATSPTPSAWGISGVSASHLSVDATLVDTTAPDLERTLTLDFCGSNDLSEASADGRWFLMVDCYGKLRIADLAATNLVSSPIGVKQQGRVAFALDGAEIVWLDEDGVVHALDAASREQVELARLEDGPFFHPFRRVVVHRATNLLAAVTGSGNVHTAGLPGAAEPRPAVKLPFLDLSGAALDLTAEPIDAAGADAYEFGGTFTASGAGATGATLPLTGHVHAERLHRYLPTELTLAWSQSPPPHLYALASAVNPDSGAELFRLEFGTHERHATSFVGNLHDVAANTHYQVRVERAADGGP
jgi:hypothetical protein